MRVLVVDDDPDIFDIVSLCFELLWPASDTERLLAPTGAAGLDAVRRRAPDLVILDIGLPDMDGFEVCQRVRQFSDVPIVFLTVRDRARDVMRGLELGADDYIVKPFAPLALLGRVRAVLRRRQAFHVARRSSIFSFGDLSLNFSGGQLHVNGTPLKLTPTEYQTLYYLARRSNRVVAPQALLGGIWGDEYRDKPYFVVASFRQLASKLRGHPACHSIALEQTPGGFVLRQLEAPSAAD